MKDQPWDLNQTWPVGQKWCRFTNAPPPKKKILWPHPKFGAQKHQILTTFSRLLHSIPHSPERNVASTNKTASVNVQCVSYKLTYFPWSLTQKRLRSVCSLWLFSSHYFETIIVVACQVLLWDFCHLINLWWNLLMTEQHWSWWRSGRAVWEVTAERRQRNGKHNRLLPHDDNNS